MATQFSDYISEKPKSQKTKTVRSVNQWELEVKTCYRQARTRCASDKMVFVLHLVVENVRVFTQI